MNEEKTYFKHLAGISAFMGWCRRWSQLPNGIAIHNQAASLGPVAVQRFGVAWPKKKRYGDRPSLLYQTTEGQWLEHVQWGRAILERGVGEYALVLVSRLVSGDGSKYMDLPAFALRIPISREQGEIWERLDPSSVPVRLLWVEEKTAHVATPSFDLPLSIISRGEDIFLPHEAASGLSFHEMLERRLVDSGVDYNPGFKGGAAGAKVDDPYLAQQVAYRESLKSGSDVANP